MYKKIVVLIILIISFVIFTGCDNSSENIVVTPAPLPDEIDAGTIIIPPYMGTPQGAMTDDINILIEAKNIKANIISWKPGDISATYNEYVEVALMSGQGETYIADYELYTLLKKQGLLKDVTDIFENNAPEYYKWCDDNKLLGNVTDEDIITAIPMSLKNYYATKYPVVFMAPETAEKYAPLPDTLFEFEDIFYDMKAEYGSSNAEDRWACLIDRNRFFETIYYELGYYDVEAAFMHTYNSSIIRSYMAAPYGSILSESVVPLEDIPGFKQVVMKLAKWQNDGITKIRAESYKINDELDDNKFGSIIIPYSIDSNRLEKHSIFADTIDRGYSYLHPLYSDTPAIPDGRLYINPMLLMGYDAEHSTDVLKFIEWLNISEENYNSVIDKEKDFEFRMDTDRDFYHQYYGSWNPLLYFFNWRYNNISEINPEIISGTSKSLINKQLHPSTQRMLDELPKYKSEFELYYSEYENIAEITGYRLQSLNLLYDALYNEYSIFLQNFDSYEEFLDRHIEDSQEDNKEITEFYRKWYEQIGY